MWTNRWPNAHLSTPIVVFWSQGWKRGSSTSSTARGLSACFCGAASCSLHPFCWQPPIHLMTWQRRRGEKRDDMWYLSNLSALLLLICFFCVKIKVSLLQTKGDWTKTFKLLYRKQTSLESLSNGWDISPWMFVICSNSAVDTKCIYTYCVISATKEGTGKASKGGLPQNKLTMIWLPVPSMLGATRIVKGV